MLHPLDFLALQSIRKALNDMPDSNFFSSCDFISNPCNFAVVYCEADKVIALNLGDPRAGSPRLTGCLDPAIGKLSALADHASQLKNLQFLSISRNFISGEIPAKLAELRSLQTLDLSYNQLRSLCFLYFIL
uniref:Uncharacterized protein n=1 Tax=Nelumbo nucifera TaxID=4432 RepID=A0A822YSV8_NELNU|nr:TPA_asm: hypothetical protein HUJ06_012737 [Nelumbo nucifera]